MFKHIVIATDGSDASQEAVREGLELAAQLGAAATVVTVRQPISFLGAPYEQKELSRQLASARAALERARAEAEPRGLEVSYEILEGEPATEIMRIAQVREADLVVVGSRGLGAVTGTLLGSVSRAVVRAADRPILVVKEPALTRKGFRAGQGAGVAA